MDLEAILGGQPQPQPSAPAQDMLDLFGNNNSTPAAPSLDLFGGPSPQTQPQQDLLGGDLLGPPQIQFPSFIAFEDSVIQVGFKTVRDAPGASTFTLTAVFKNKTGEVLSQVNVQAAAQKYMTLKMKPPGSSQLGPFASDLTQEMALSNSLDGQKPLALKLKINYTQQG